MFPEDPEALRDELQTLASQNGWKIEAERRIPHGLQLRIQDETDLVAVSLYDNGRVLIQGCPSPLKSAVDARVGRQAHATSPSTPHIGIDESGKGDYFGPLVVAAVYVDAKAEMQMADLGVRDSKAISDSRVAKLAKHITSGLPHSVITINPLRYNQLHTKLGNLNRLLAWGHARALENVLERVKCDRAISDQFGDASLVEKALLSRGRRIQLEQHPHAEEDIAVAAASILARAEFVRRLALLSRDAGMELPKGASPEVERVGRKLVAERGPEALERFAKIHFVTTKRIQ